MTQANSPKKPDDNISPVTISTHVNSILHKSKELDNRGDLALTLSGNGNHKVKVTDPLKCGEVLLSRFRVVNVLGEGTFGKVYLATDEHLNRLVAIKVSNEIIKDKNVLSSILSEAQMLAKLDHPNIVPVLDVGNSESEGFFIISKYLDGGTYSQAIRKQASDITWVCKTIALIADGLHHAHIRGLVHRDIKPDNILLDASGCPCIVDFGLALTEEALAENELRPFGDVMGTCLYMSPEQAGGEGHRVDGRSDIFSLGVILYEILAGRRPFEDKNVMVLLQMIKMGEVKPIRQFNPTIPKELERICLKAMSRKLLDRYATAADMAADLRSFVASVSLQSGDVKSAPSVNMEDDKSGLKSGNMSGMDFKNFQVVHKGLRSFDQADAGFFLELLPGSRDREGLPSCIRFWKSQIENPSSSFSVGVIYGPSGCGKSSLMKAGLIPNLDGKIIPIYLEATATNTEESILKQLRKRLPDLPPRLTLLEAFELIRKKKPAGLNRKLLLIVDQFEQWLHANPNMDNAPLAQALRQVDGDYFKVILMIRDDFILAMNRMMAVLEISIVEGVNFSLVDLFEQKHSRKVLRLFGRALQCLPEGELSRDQQQFIHKSIEALSVDGKVVSIRLSIFAEMMKSRPWLTSSLNSIGGVEGVGVQFLEKTFFSTSAPVLCKIHYKAAQNVLKALLPSTGSSIKGSMLSLEELKEVSTYANKPHDFEQLLQLLDSDLRLITPTTREEDSDSKRFYQLAHDYLVPSLQEWLLKKQKETMKGRAELVLEDRARVWNLNPENRHLLSLLHWLSTHWNIPSRDWTKPQRKMIKKASKYYLVRSFLITASMVLLSFLFYEGYSRVKSHGLVERLLDANFAAVPTIVNEISGYRRWANPMLSTANNKAEQEKDERKQMHTSLALLPVDKTQITYLYSRLLEAKPNEVEVLVNALGSYKEDLVEQLWTVLLNPEKGKELQILRAASALAAYDRGSSINWEKSSSLIVSQLVKENPVFIGVWVGTLRPVKKFLLNPLSETFRNKDTDKAVENSVGTNLLADYSSDQSEILASLALDADEKQFAILFPVLKQQKADVLLFLSAEINKNIPLNAPDDTKEIFVKRQVNAAVALAKLNQSDTIWPLLKHTPDPRRRSYLIHKLSSCNLDHNLILQQLKVEKEVSIRRALIQSLGEFHIGQISIEERKTITPLLQDIYLKDLDPGIHASAEWLLKTWNEQSFINKTNEAWQKDKEQSLKRQIEITKLLDKGKEKSLMQWYVNGQGQTMVVIPGPVEFLMGSPESEAGRIINEVQHKKQIVRSFEISNKAVTLAQYKQFAAKHTLDAKYIRSGDLPAVGINWYFASKYCNWLSEKEGIPEEQWCYEMNIKGNVTALKKDYVYLKGYRLPTEAEMEYATRAGSITSRYYGETEELLPKFAWVSKNSHDQPWPVGTLKPNDFGLFDMLGNNYSWCMDELRNYPKVGSVMEDMQEGEDVSNTIRRVVRGGAYNFYGAIIRSSIRSSGSPIDQSVLFGFRLAKTK